MQEGQCAGIHGTGLAVVHQQDEGHVLVHDLEGAVEELAAVEGAGVDPLHLHHQADGGGVSDLHGSAAGHDVDDGSVLVLLSELLGRLAGRVGSVLGSLEHVGQALDHLVILVEAFHLLQDLHSQCQNIAHLFQLGGVVL